MRDVTKPYVEVRGNTVIGFDPGDDRGERACRVTMERDPKTSVMTVTEIRHWPYQKPIPKVNCDD